MSEMNKRSGEGAEQRESLRSRFNAEQLTEYLNMEAAYKDMTKRAQELFDDRGNLSDAEFEDLSRRYAYATIQMVKMRSFVRGPRV